MLAAAVLAAPLPGSGLAQARTEDPSTAAQTDQMLRPHFDFLEQRRRARGPGGHPALKPPKLEDSVLVDCARRESLQLALDHVRDHGVLNVRGTCVMSSPLVLYFPVKIVGSVRCV